MREEEAEEEEDEEEHDEEGMKLKTCVRMKLREIMTRNGN